MTRRTTLTIDDDVLAAAKGVAASQHRTLGEVISELARQALHRPVLGDGVRNGIPLLPNREDVAPVTLELVKQLCDAPG